MASTELHSYFYQRYYNTCYMKCIHMRSFVDYAAIKATQKQSWESQRNDNVNAAVDADSNTYVSLLQACTSIKVLKQTHAHILINGLDQNIFLGSKLISMYAMLGGLKNARLVFDKIYERNVFLWNSMIREYGRNDSSEDALILYHQMQQADMQPNNFTFPFVLKACAGLSALQEGKEVHYHIVRAGLESDVFVAAALVDMYGKCGCVVDARQVFDKMSTRDLVLWNAMIAGYVQNGHADEAFTLFRQMQLADVKPNSVTMVSVLTACGRLGALEQGKGIHDYIIRNGFESNVFVGTALIDMYAKHGNTEDARQIFDKMPEANVVSWNAMIAGYAQNGHANEALKIFNQMHLEDVNPNLVTMVSVLLACAHAGAMEQGKLLHDYIIKSGFESIVSVGNALIDMYAKCGSIEDARQVFDGLSARDVVSWTAMIAGYVQNGHDNEAMLHVHQMQLAGVIPDSVVLVSVLSSCAHLGAVQQGKCIHDYMIRSGLESDVYVQNSLIDMYAKCGSIDIARRLFDKMSMRNVVSWSAMIAGYVQNGHASEALTLFNQMQLADVKPNSVTMVSVLSSYAHLGALQQGKWIHDYLIRSGLESDVFVATALIDMYAKCGSVEIARQIFDKLSKRNVVTWNAMIAGYGMHGLGEDALALFFRMQQAGMKPNHITFVCVLSACSHAGLVDEGWQYFDCMSRDYCITPRLKHYACMVDLLGRAGHLEKAWDFIKRMPLEPDAGVWGALLGACRIHCNIELGKYVAEHLFDLEPENAGYYVLLSNIYAAAGRWDDVAKVRTMMKERGLKKTAGCSLIEVNNRIHAFLVGDESHPQSDKIYKMLETLSEQMKNAGYVPHTNFVLHDVEEEVKEDMLSSHSEKLAIAFGLINTGPGTPIWITKNLRVCGDCHSATRFISKIVKREIIVRDANRFHHFKDGLCSCGEYW